MSVNHSLSGEIKISPELTWPEVQAFKELEGRWSDRPYDVELRRTEVVSDTELGRLTIITADAIVVRDEANGRWVQEELANIAKQFPEHTFTGYIHCAFELGHVGADDMPCERYYIQNGEVHTAQPELIWPTLPQWAEE